MSRPLPSTSVAICPAGGSALDTFVVASALKKMPE
jgi:hypothetical protein